MLDEKEAVLVTTVLEDCLEKLEILNMMAPSMDHDDVFLDDEGEGMPTVINEKHRLFPDGLHNRVGIADENYLKWKAFHSGRIYLEDVLKTMLHELQTKRSCETLVEIIEKEKLSKLEDVQTVLKRDMKEERLQFLKRDLRQIKRDRTENVKQAEETLKYLKKMVFKTKARNIVSEKYSKKQEEVRLEQTKKKLTTQLEETKEEIEKLKLKIEDERRIHTEIESFCNHEYQCKENDLQFWIDKYNKETKEMDKKIRDLRIEKEKQLAIYLALVERYNEYTQVLKEDAEEKRIERERIELEEKRKKSALMIQCWWRAVMVRRFLGQFRSLKRAIHQRKLKAKALAKAASKKSKK